MLDDPRRDLFVTRGVSAFASSGCSAAHVWTIDEDTAASDAAFPTPWLRLDCPACGLHVEARYSGRFATPAEVAAAADRVFTQRRDLLARLAKD